jgi:TetR/AcrR family transcriptional regulator, transcriptional repressor for nem operon
MSDTKNYIIHTSLLLFLQKSYRDVTMQEIVQKTGLSKGAFYHYFTSKEQLFKEIASLFFSAGNLKYNQFPDDSLQSFIDAYVEGITQGMEAIYELITGDKNDQKVSLNFFLILFESIARFPEFLEFELKQYIESLEAWSVMIAKARQTGEIFTDATDKDIANLFLYCSDGVFVRFANSDKERNFTDDLRNAMETIYKGLKA